MSNLTKRIFSRLSLDSESGVTAIEYGLIAALIAVVIIISVTAVGTAVSGVFAAIAVAINGAL
jgi:pilus assembly protein Flp/PilA